MSRWFRHMSAHKAVVICAAILLASYVFATSGVDLSCAPDTLIEEAVRSRLEEPSTPPPPTPTAAPTPTPVSNARWALEEAIGELDGVSSFVFETRLTGSDIVNRGFVVRPSLISIELAAAQDDATLAHVRLVAGRVFIALPSSDGPSEADASGTDALDGGDDASAFLEWRELSSAEPLAGVVHMDPGLFLSSVDEFLGQVNSEIIMDGGGQRWRLSGLVEPEFMKRMGVSWNLRTGRDYPMQYIVSVSADEFVPDEFVFIPYGSGQEITLSLSDHDRPGVRPAIPADAVSMDDEAAAILIQDIRQRAEVARRAAVLASTPVAAAPDMAAATAGDSDLASASPAVVSQTPGALAPEVPGSLKLAEILGGESVWREFPSERAGWRGYEMPDVDLTLELPETWRVMWSNGSVFVNSEGDIENVGVRNVAEGLVGGISSVRTEFAWGWFGWDTLAGGDAPFVFVVGYDYGDVGLASAVEVYRNDVVGMNPTLISEPAYRTFVSDAGAVCAMAEYEMSLLVGGGFYNVADCLFASSSGYVGVIVGARNAGFSEIIMGTVR